MSILDGISGFNRKYVIKYIISTGFQWTYSFLKCHFANVDLLAPFLSFCFLWMVGMKFKLKQHRTTFPFEIRVSHENVNGFTSWSGQLSFSAVFTYNCCHCSLVLIYWKPANLKLFYFSFPMNLQFCLNLKHSWLLLYLLLSSYHYSSCGNKDNV